MQMSGTRLRGLHGWLRRLIFGDGFEIKRQDRLEHEFVLIDDVLVLQPDNDALDVLVDFLADPADAVATASRMSPPNGLVLLVLAPRPPISRMPICHGATAPSSETELAPPTAGAVQTW